MSIIHEEHQPGRSFPLGATLSRDGANCSVCAKHSAAVQLLLFGRVDDPEPSPVIDLDPHTDRTYIIGTHSYPA
jgi:glycogen operon protein